MRKSHYCSCLVEMTPHKPICIFSIPQDSAYGADQALICTTSGFLGLRQAGPRDTGIKLSEPTPIRIRDPREQAEAGQGVQPDLVCACWDPFANGLFAVIGNAVARVSENGDATVIAGNLTERGNTDGIGSATRFGSCCAIISDGEGSLYVIDTGALRRLQLPSSWQQHAAPIPAAAGAATQPTCGKVAGGDPQLGAQGAATGQQPGSREPGAGSDHACGEVRVISVPCGELSGKLKCGAYDPLTRSLVLCTKTSVYRLHTEGGLTAASPAGAAAAAAGAEGTAAAARGGAAAAADSGPGKAAASAAAAVAMDAKYLTADTQPLLVADMGEDSEIFGVTVDGTGCIWLSDSFDDSDGRGVRTMILRAVDSNGNAVTMGIVDYRYFCYHSPAVLHNGCLALVASDERLREVLLLHLDLPPPAVAGPRSTSLGHHSSKSSSSSNKDQHAVASDLGALLDRQPDSSADVEVVVGGQVFAAHRSVLAARSPYLAQRLNPGAGFADTGASRLSLPDADPRVFGAVLRYMYTDSTGPVPPELLQPVGELADRLLLPGLCAQVGDQLLLQVRPDNVVGLLLWAEQRRGSFAQLLSGLKAWFLGQHAAGGGRGWVLPDREVVRLMREGPEDLAVELMYHQRPDVRQHKRPRGA